MAGHLYKLQYRLDEHPEGFDVEAAKAAAEDGFGSCDAMLMASLIFPEDGSYSCLFMSKDGRTGGDLDDLEWFKVWMMLSKRLGESRTLDAGRKEFAADVFDTLRQIIYGRPSPQEPDA